MVKSGQALTVLFVTQNPATGAAADATGTPVGTLYVNGTANGATVTVTNITTGVYKAAMTLPALAAGDVVSIRIAATVAAVAGESIVFQDIADTLRVSDITTLDAAGIRGAIGMAAADLDAQLAALPTAAENAAAVQSAANNCWPPLGG